MKRFFYPSILILVFCTVAFAQATSSCPQIKIIAPRDVTRPGATMTFLVSPDETAKNTKLKYKWTVSAGSIIGGEETYAVTVDTTGLNGINITAEVEIKGLPENCSKDFNAVGAVANVPENIDCDSYDKLARQEEIARLEQIAIGLQIYPGSVVQFIIVTKKNATAKETNDRISKILNYISNRRKIPKNRLFFAIEQNDYESTRVCMWDKPERIIKCKDCKIIKGEDFNLKSSSKRKSSPR